MVTERQAWNVSYDNGDKFSLAANFNKRMTYYK
jgi:hypothetical protein